VQRVVDSRLVEEPFLDVAGTFYKYDVGAGMLVGYFRVDGHTRVHIEVLCSPVTFTVGQRYRITVFSLDGEDTPDRVTWSLPRWQPTPSWIAALPTPLRSYIKDLQLLNDPEELLAENRRLWELCEKQEQEIARLERLLGRRI
jgi:hypothetical protein